MRFRIAIALAVMMTMASVAFAQQPAAVPLGDVARKAEAEKATVKKAKKTYTNANLSADPKGEPESESASAAPAGFVSRTTGQALTADEMISVSKQKEAAEEQARTAESEPQWRGRADSLRLQIDRLQKRQTLLTKPNPGREANAAAQARAEIELTKIRDGLAALRKRWSGFEDEARTAKIPTDWLEPRPTWQ